MKAWIGLLCGATIAFMQGCATSALLHTGDPTAPTAPVLVLWTNSGSPFVDRSPRAAVYSDRTILYAPFHAPEQAPSFFQASLSQAQYERLYSADTTQPLSELKPSYFVAAGVDPNDHILQWRANDNSMRQIVVSGILDHPRVEADRSRTPKAFLNIFDKLSAFASPPPTPYIPTSFQVELIHIKQSGIPAVEWPATWPQPQPMSEKIRREFGEGLTAQFPGPQFSEVHDWIWKHQDAGQLVTYQGQLYFPMTRADLPGSPAPLVTPAPTSP